VFFFVTFKIPSNTANNISVDQNGCVSFLFHSLLSFKKFPTPVFQTKLEINTYKTFYTCYHSPSVTQIIFWFTYNNMFVNI